MSEAPALVSLALLSAFINGSTDLEKTLQRLVQLGRDTLPATTFVGLTMPTGTGQPATPVFTDAVVCDLEQAQFGADSGPCLAALRTGRIHRFESTQAGERRWPEFARECTTHGITAALSLPIVGVDRPAGALNLYSRDRDAYTVDGSTQAALLEVMHVATALANVLAYARVKSHVDNVETMLAEHDRIEQATGVIMFKMRYTADEAYQHLVHASQQQNCAVIATATDVVSDAVTPPTTDRRSGVTGDQRISPLPAAVARRRRAMGSENTSEITDTAARLHTWWEGLGHEHQQAALDDAVTTLPAWIVSSLTNAGFTLRGIRWGTDERLQFDVPDELHDFLRIKRRRRGTED
jgi:hypothetical protein